MKISRFLFLGVLLLFSTVLPGQTPDAGRPVTLTVLYDNYPFGEGLTTDWGFSALIEGTEKTILFDTGTKPAILLQNLKALAVEAKAVDLVAFSHFHGDHTGGLLEFLKLNGQVTVYTPSSFSDKFLDEVRRAGAEVKRTNEAVEICRGVRYLGETGSQIPEQALVISTPEGLAVVTGCAHPGIVDMLKKARRDSGRDIALVLGGFHLLDKSEGELRAIVGEFKALGVRKVGATHCTGDKAIALFKEAYGENFVPLGVGRKIVIAD